MTRAATSQQRPRVGGRFAKRTAAPERPAMPPAPPQPAPAPPQEAPPRAAQGALGALLAAIRALPPDAPLPDVRALDAALADCDETLAAIRAARARYGAARDARLRERVRAALERTA